MANQGSHTGREGGKVGMMNTDEPKHGDLLIPNNWTVDYIAEGMVWFIGLRNPIERGDVAKVRPGVWKLTKMNSTDDEK